MTARFTISLPDDDLARIDALAAEQGVTRSELVREATERYIASSREGVRAAERREAGERMMQHLKELREGPSLDGRPVLDMLREMRGPLESREPWDDGSDLP